MAITKQNMNQDWFMEGARERAADDGKQQHPERITKNTRDRLAQELLDNGNISEAKINMLTHMSGTDPSDILEASPDVDFDFNDAEQPLPRKVKNNRSKSEPLPVSGSPEERAKTQRIIERNNQASKLENAYKEIRTKDVEIIAELKKVSGENGKKYTPVREIFNKYKAENPNASLSTFQDYLAVNAAHYNEICGKFGPQTAENVLSNYNTTTFEDRQKCRIFNYFERLINIHDDWTEQQLKDEFILVDSWERTGSIRQGRYVYNINFSARRRKQLDPMLRSLDTKAERKAVRDEENKMFAQIGNMMAIMDVNHEPTDFEKEHARKLQKRKAQIADRRKKAEQEESKDLVAMAYDSLDRAAPNGDVLRSIEKKKKKKKAKAEKKKLRQKAKKSSGPSNIPSITVTPSGGTPMEAEMNGTSSKMAGMDMDMDL